MTLFDAADRWQAIHFTGIGGVGMAALAFICDDIGIRVTGSDLVASSHTRLLTARGINIHIGTGGSVPADTDLLVYSSAVPVTDRERQAAAAAGIPQIRRGEFLGELAACAPIRIAVAGSHGKTTTTAMIAHILRSSGRNCAYAVGGLVNGWLVPAAAGDGSIFVFEVDESDGTQTAVAASHAVITNLDDDHCWSVGGEAALDRIFTDFAGRADRIFISECPKLELLLATCPNLEVTRPADGAGLALTGAHNRSNGALAARVCASVGVPAESIPAILATFGGVDRRLTVRAEGSIMVVEDYAHHPVELRATLAAVREKWPDRAITVVFQAHRYERVARYGQEFAALLATADQAIVVRPFGAWIDDDNLADPRVLLTGLGTRGRYSEAPWDILADELARDTAPDSLILIIGAGTIHALPPALIVALNRH